MPIRLRWICVCAASILAHTLRAHAACGVSGCAVNTHWQTQGAHLGSGLRLDVRFEYVNQDTPRRGSKRVRGEAAHGEEQEAHAQGAAAPARALDDSEAHEDEPHAEHQEQSTLNRNVRIDLDYAINANWGVDVEIPVVKREHRHIEVDSAEQERWDFTALGDMRVRARYVFAGNAASSWGLTFGAKLPTGEFDKQNREGELAERTLQPGSGTTDALIGAFYQRSDPASAWSWFAQGALQQALNSRDEFKPGRFVSIDAGAGYRFKPSVSALLQLNLQHRARDKGANAEAQESGGKFAFLSPGVQLRLGANTQAYAFVQVPIHQDVNGTQLTANEAFLVGLSHRF
jgi:hypothetical protein